MNLQTEGYQRRLDILDEQNIFFILWNTFYNIIFNNIMLKYIRPRSFKKFGLKMNSTIGKVNDKERRSIPSSNQSV